MGARSLPPARLRRHDRLRRRRSGRRAPDAPWPATSGLEPIGTDAIVRHFGGRHYVVSRDLDLVQ
jgi:hypothetical protein